MPHEDAIAQAPDAAEVGVELERQRPPEDLCARCRFDRVEPGQTFQRRFDLLRRLDLGIGPAVPPRLGREVVAHQAFGP